MDLPKTKRPKRTYGLTQQELAEIIKVSTKTISRYEQGQTLPRYREIYDKLSEVLDTNHDYLVTDEDDFKFIGLPKKPEKNTQKVL